MFDGFNELENELKDILKDVDNIEEILEIGAKEFVDDALKLPKPKSNINSSKHTHLVDSFSYEKSKHKKGQIEVGWGVYYGPLVENGTKFMKKQSHLEPLFNKNKEKYYNKMIKKIY